jgi:predicted ATPase
MITGLRLGNFKCFEDEFVPLKGLTLLSGINGSGKSSIVQALLVLRQFCLRGIFTGPYVSLSGGLVDLGPATEILFTSATDDMIRLERSDQRGVVGRPCGRAGRHPGHGGPWRRSL